MDDEIDLRAYAEVLWRGRYAIGVVTLAAVLVAFAVSRFLLTPVYTASVMLVVESQGQPPREDPSQLLPWLAATRPAPLDSRGYQEIVQSAAFQEALRQTAQRVLGPDVGYKVSARVVPQTAMVELSAEANGPEQAARLANEAAALLLQEAERLNRARLERALALLEAQSAQAKANLDQALERLQAFTRRGPSVEERQNELNGKLELLAEYQKRLTQLDVVLATETTKLKELQAQLASEPQRLTLKKALSPEAPALTQAIRGLGLSIGDPLMSLDDEQVNPVYVDLRTRVATQEVAVAALREERTKVQAALDQLSEEVQRLSTELIGLQAEQRELTWQAETARRLYETAAVQYESQRGALAARLGESALSLVAPAPIPRTPSRPKPLLNAVVAGFMGLTVSVIGVFVAEFWRQPAKAVARATSGAAAHGS